MITFEINQSRPHNNVGHPNSNLQKEQAKNLFFLFVLNITIFLLPKFELYSKQEKFQLHPTLSAKHSRSLRSLFFCESAF
jgi:predicted 2-oxoglutarate/Fe(II)-dependent dioxygenase YbiX